MKGNIVVGQSGGPTAVINSSVAGVYAAAKALGANKVYGMVHGIEGFLKDKLTDLDDYLADDMGIELLKRTPSAFLGSCRFKMPKIEGHEDVYEKVFEIMVTSSKDPAVIIEEQGLALIDDIGTLTAVVKKVIENNLNSVNDYKSGNKKALGFLMGQAMKETKGKADPKLLNNIFKEELEK